MMKHVHFDSDSLMLMSNTYVFRILLNSRSEAWEDSIPDFLFSSVSQLRCWMDLLIHMCIPGQLLL